MGMAKATIGNNSYIGAFGLATDSFVLVTDSATNTERRILEENLGHEPIGLKVDGSGLVGVYVVANASGILLPETVDDSWVRKLRTLLPGIEVEMMRTSLNALKNNILTNDKIAFVNHEYSDKEIAIIEDVLGVEAIKMRIGSYDTVGANNIITNNGIVLNNSATDDEIEYIKKRIGSVSQSTANMGSSSIGLCAIANSSGAVVGSQTTGFELVRISEGLGL